MITVEFKLMINADLGK